MPKLTKEQKKTCQWLRAWEAKRRKDWRHVERVKIGFGSNWRFPIFGDFHAPTEKEAFDSRIFVTEGGWFIGRRWMSTRELEQALDRWVKRSLNMALPEAVTEGEAYQCGGCRFFGAFDGDYGLCCNPGSPEDGRVVYEHGGCPEHSWLSSNKERVNLSSGTGVPTTLSLVIQTTDCAN